MAAITMGGDSNAIIDGDPTLQVVGCIASKAMNAIVSHASFPLSEDLALWSNIAISCISWLSEDALLAG